MRQNSNSIRLKLATGLLWSRSVRGEVRISCLDGVLWLTRSGDNRDYLLHAGESLEFSGNSHIVIEALKDATVCWNQSGTQSVLTSARRWLRAWLTQGAALPTAR
jgi:hypothetical protein